MEIKWLKRKSVIFSISYLLGISSPIIWIDIVIKWIITDNIGNFYYAPKVNFNVYNKQPESFL